MEIQYIAEDQVRQGFLLNWRAMIGGQLAGFDRNFFTEFEIRLDNMNSAALQALAYRMNAIAIGHLSLRHEQSWDEIPSIAVYFNGKQVIEGRATGLTNGAIEAAIIHSRALLDFLGLKAKSKSKLAEREALTKTDDVGIENFGGLSRVSIKKAINAYPGPEEEAEAALAYVIHVANKSLAHTTDAFRPHNAGNRLLEIAFRGVPVLMINNFYTPLKLKPPKYELESRTETP